MIRRVARRLRHWLMPPPAPATRTARVLANSIPKAGTNLLTRLLEVTGFPRSGHFDAGPDEGLLPLPPAAIASATEFLAGIPAGRHRSAHLYHAPEVASQVDALGVRSLLIVRDPRDVCVSDAFYVAATPEHRLHPYYARMTLEEQIMASIVGMTPEQLDGGPPSLDIGSHYRGFQGWLAHPGTLVLDFRDLIGAKGGGSDEAQRACVARVASHLGIPATPDELAGWAGEIFWPGSPTFRRGTIGAWRMHFTPAHVEAFERVAGSVAREFGYGPD